MEKGLEFLVLNFIRKTKCLLNLTPRAGIESNRILAEEKTKRERKPKYVIKMI